jgi:futalosine hydrolase
MEADGNWRDIHDMKLADPDGFPYQEKLLRNPHDALLKASRLPAVRAVSVNCVTTDKLMIRRLSDTYSPDVESMEGAAFHYVCLQEGVPFLQLRGISNLIGDRDKDRWQMQQALENVQAALIRFLNNLAEPGLI